MATLHEIKYNVTTTGRTDVNFEKMFNVINSIKNAVDKLNKTEVAPVVSNSVNRNLDDISSKAKQTSGIFSGLAKSIAGFFAYDMIKGFGSKIVQTGADFEMMQLQLTNLTGSAQKGADAFKMFQADATKLPFDLKDIVAANAGIMATGESAEQSQRSMNALANATAFAGKNSEVYSRMAENLAQIKSKGGADSMDIRQFQSAGINISGALEKSFGKSFEQLKKEGPVTFEMISKALEDAQKKGGLFEGGIESLANSTGVKLSNLGDSFDIFAMDLFNAMKPAINGLIEIVGDFIGGLRSGLVWIQQNKDIVASLAGAVGVVTLALIAYNLQQKWAAIYSAATTAGLFIQMVATDGLAAALYAAGLAGAAMWIAITGGLALVVAGLVMAYRKFEGFRGVIHGLWGAVKQVFTNIGDFFVKTFEPIFKAIDNLKNGKYFEAGKNILELTYNLTPAGMIATGFETLGKDTGKAYTEGWRQGAGGLYTQAPQIMATGPGGKEVSTFDMLLGKRADSWSTLGQSDIKEKNKKLDDKIDKSLKNNAKGNQNVLKNINITFESLQKIMGNQIIGKKDGQEIIDNLNDGFMTILNNSAQIITR